MPPPTYNPCGSLEKEYFNPNFPLEHKRPREKTRGKSTRETKTREQTKTRKQTREQSKNATPPLRTKETAQEKAAKKGQDRVVRLLRRDDRTDPEVYDSIVLAATSGHYEVVQLLLADPRANPATVHSAARWAAAKYGHDKTVQLLDAHNARR